MFGYGVLQYRCGSDDVVFVIWLMRDGGTRARASAPKKYCTYSVGP